MTSSLSERLAAIKQANTPRTIEDYRSTSTTPIPLYTIVYIAELLANSKSTNILDQKTDPLYKIIKWLSPIELPTVPEEFTVPYALRNNFLLTHITFRVMLGPKDRDKIYRAVVYTYLQRHMT